jgi:hypothetical protein
MKKFGIDALCGLPDSSKPRRIFSLSNTLGKEKEDLRRIMKESLKEYDPVEINVPPYVKHVNEFFERWDHDMFYREIKKFQETIVNEKFKTEMIKRDDFLRYTGDIDNFMSCLGNFLFVDTKKSIQALKLNQTAAYLGLSKTSNQKVWFIVGPTPNMEDPNYKIVEYKLCEVYPNGEFRWYNGTLSEVFRYFCHWLEWSYDNQITDEQQNVRIAKKLIASTAHEETFESLSLQNEFLDFVSKYE